MVRIARGPGSGQKATDNNKFISKGTLLQSEPGLLVNTDHVSPEEGIVRPGVLERCLLG
jgi:hypothetical protein